MKRECFALVFSCLISSLLYGQRMENTIAKSYNTYKAEQPVEYAYLRTNKKIYFSGESLGFYLTVLDQYYKPSQISKIAYLELIHEGNEYQEKYAFKVNNGISNGVIDIPLDIPTGNYQLVAYTHFMNNFHFEESLHRRLIYIQNSVEPTEAIAKSLEASSDVYREDSTSGDNDFSIKKNETSTKVLLEINAKQKVNKECFIVSEGFRGIQFVARAKLNKKKVNLSLSRDQFTGGFQKIILLDNNLEILTAVAFYLDNSTKPNSAYQLTSDSVSFSNEETLLGKIELTSEILHQDSIDLFRRMYQLYYNIPSSQEIEELSFKELTSDNTLSKFTKYITQKWTGILSNEIAELRYRPESNLHLRGQVEGDLTKIKGAILGVHLFDSNLDFLEDLDETGKIDVEVFWPIESDRFYCSITNSRNKDVSSSFNIKFDYGPKISYGTNQSYYPRNLTDPMIDQRIEFSYILSTFSPFAKKNKYFWQNYKVDRVVDVGDYRDLASFEELVREAVLDLSVVKEDGAKSLNIYNSYGGGFRTPQLIILNNQILNRSTPLFELPIQSIESLRMIYSKELLDDFGEIFIGGVVIVETNEDISVPEEYIEDKTGFITGFKDQSSLNQVSRAFSWSKLLRLYTNDQIKIGLGDNNERGSYQFSIETIMKDGTYQNHRDQVKLD